VGQIMTNGELAFTEIKQTLSSLVWEQTAC